MLGPGVGVGVGGKNKSMGRSSNSSRKSIEIYLWVLETSQLLDEEHEDSLDLLRFLVGGVRSKYPENVGHTAGRQ